MAGMPWYAGQSSGVNIPSLGYVIGFVLAAGIVGALASRGGDRSPGRTTAWGSRTMWAVRTDAQGQGPSMPGTTWRSNAQSQSRTGRAGPTWSTRWPSPTTARWC